MPVELVSSHKILMVYDTHTKTVTIRELKGTEGKDATPQYVKVDLPADTLLNACLLLVSMGLNHYTGDFRK